MVNSVIQVWGKKMYLDLDRYLKEATITVEEMETQIAKHINGSLYL